ncbi:MAG: DNA mismatch repair endonuclease MutL [Firmicutes bacterium]|nr:DNA mismatch repair endonuclease MutL [Bacillota bacterium]
MSKIKVMNEILANKIAAGEVIEKIASVVKELVENSIDAGSENIKVNLTGSGIKAIEVIDDGSGMDREDAKTAFLRHATSKIYKEDDLYFIDTLGFRGEALASIASVSEVKMSTCNGSESTYIEIKGGHIIDIRPCPERRGTSIEVSNIFYNTPARLKYLKSDATELANCTSFIERLALSHPDIAFTLTNNGKMIVKTSGSGNLHKTIHEIFGMEVSNNILEFKNVNDDFAISGYACKPHILKSNRNQMITLINNRIVRNNEINNAINDAYYTYKPEGKYPVVVLNIETDPTIVDVNIHPTKQDVKISKIDELCEMITSAIKTALYENLLIIKPLEDVSKIDETKDEIPFEEEKILIPETKNEQVFMDFQSEEVIHEQNIKSLVLYPVGLAHGTYIIAENEDGMYIIDQHAAYERINYERYMKRLAEKEVAKMNMLIPITIEFSPSEFLDLMQKKDVLTSLNIDVEEFGINTIIVKSHPTWLKEGYEEESIRKIIDLVLLLDSKFDRVKFEEKIAITLACKMSIKANMHISYEEMEYILGELVKCDNPYNCPHGRPTIIKFTIYDLEKMFKRVMD